MHGVERAIVVVRPRPRRRRGWLLRARGVVVIAVRDRASNLVLVGAATRAHRCPCVVMVRAAVIGRGLVAGQHARQKRRVQAVAAGADLSPLGNRDEPVARRPPMDADPDLRPDGSRVAVVALSQRFDVGDGVVRNGVAELQVLQPIRRGRAAGVEMPMPQPAKPVALLVDITRAVGLRELVTAVLTAIACGRAQASEVAGVEHEGAQLRVFLGRAEDDGAKLTVRQALRIFPIPRGPDAGCVPWHRDRGVLALA